MNDNSLIPPRWHKTLVFVLVGSMIIISIVSIAVLTMCYQVLGDFHAAMLRDERIQKSLASGDQELIDLLAFDRYLSIGFLAAIAVSTVLATIVIFIFVKLARAEFAARKP